MSLETLEDMDPFPGADDSGGLLEPNMIPAVATEVVMSGDGAFQDFPGAGADDEYQYEYAYEDADDPHHLQMEEEEVVVTEEEYPGAWKEASHKKINLYDVLDDHSKIYMEEKPSKRSRLGHDSQFGEVYQTETPGGEESAAGDFAFAPGEVEEYREYTVYTNRANKPVAHHQTNAADRSCPGCGMTLRRSVYYHHARMIREKGACNLFTPQRFPCTECDARIGTLEKLCQHMEQIHNAPTQIKTVIFTNEEDFKAFRIELEGKGGNFRMARGNKKNKKGVVQYFRCNRLQTLARSQTFRPVDNPALEELPSNRKRGRLHQQELRAQSAKQVIRTENSCTAFYNKAYLDNGTIEVRYCDHHLHDDEKLRLPDAVRKRVIELARKNLPHVVILMIVKDERFKFCDRNSANDRRIQEMKTQDIRQVLAGNNRAEKKDSARAQRGEQQRETSFEKHHNGDEYQPATEYDPTSVWNDPRPITKVERSYLSNTETRYLDLFEANREEIMARLNEKTRAEQDKKMLYDSFIHRLSSSHEVFKHLHPRQIVANEGTLLKLKKAFNLLTKIEAVLLNPRRETGAPVHFSSYIRMMEDEYRLERARSLEHSEQERRAEVDGEEVRNTGGAGAEEIDVVGLDEEEYHHMHHRGQEVEEEEVGRYHHHEEETDEFPTAMEEDDYLRGQIVEEEEVEIEMEQGQEEEELVDPETVEEEEEEIHVEVHEEQEGADEEMNGDEEEKEGESAEPTVTRAGRIVKKKPLFES
ncbi:unnamed protein product [Caenorhabditis sp. 36 PRJEB53466]|nr:unnamed protein product [Caenorhabditis sp. 36 PRJEB53466]